MGLFSSKEEILIDEEALQEAIDELTLLSNDVEELRKKLADMVDELEKGFDTPAGRKFCSGYRNGLLKPLQDQSAVFTHISKNLKTAKSSYRSVFTEYSKINNHINEFK